MRRVRGRGSIRVVSAPGELPSRARARRKSGFPFTSSLGRSCREVINECQRVFRAASTDLPVFDHLFTQSRLIPLKFKQTNKFPPLLISRCRHHIVTSSCTTIFTTHFISPTHFPHRNFTKRANLNKTSLPRHHKNIRCCSRDSHNSCK